MARARLFLVSVVLLAGNAWGAWSGNRGGGGFMMPPAGEIPMPSAFPSLQTDGGQARGNALRMAAREGRIKRVRAMLDSGVDANASGEFGETALFEAARFGHTQVATLLLERGAEVNARNSRDETALIAASRNCSPAIVEELLKRGADANWTNFEGRTALIEAAMDGCAMAVRRLLQVPGIRVHHRDSSGRTALDYAAEGVILETEGPYTETIRMLKATAPAAPPRTTEPAPLP